MTSAASRHSPVRRARYLVRARCRARCASSPTSPTPRASRPAMIFRATSSDRRNAPAARPRASSTCLSATHAAIRLVGFYDHEGGYIDNKPGTRCYSRPNDQGIGGRMRIARARPRPIRPSPSTRSPINNSQLRQEGLQRHRYLWRTCPAEGRCRRRLDGDAGYRHTSTRSPTAPISSIRASAIWPSTISRPITIAISWYLASMTVKGKISDWDVTYAGSYFHRTIDNTQDYSYFSVAYDPVTDYNLLQGCGRATISIPPRSTTRMTRYTKMSHELRINSPKSISRSTSDRWSYSCSDRPITTSPTMRSTASPTQWSITTRRCRAPTPTMCSSPTSIAPIKRLCRCSRKASWDILPNLTLTGGIRGFIAQQHADWLLGRIGHTKTFQLHRRRAGLPGDQRSSVNETGETHKVNLTWKIDRDRMVYATYSTGFRPGGNNRPGIRARRDPGSRTL